VLPSMGIRKCLSFSFSILERKTKTLSNMYTPRQNEILEVAKLKGQVSVDSLVQQFGVTPQSIRKDLGILSEGRLLERVHGGARLASMVDNVSYEARRVIAHKEKQAIGEAVANIIPSNASLFINIGTTNEAIARALVHHKRLMIITNNINIASILSPLRENQVFITAGKVRSSDGGIVGESTIDFINQFQVDYAIIGASAVNLNGDLLDFDIREVKVSQAIVSNAKHVILASDSTKYERTAPVRIGHISKIDSFVTDRVRNPEFRKLLDSFEVNTTETSI